MTYRNLLIEDRGAVRRIVINRPDKLNALDRDTIGELHSAFAQAGATHTGHSFTQSGSNPPLSTGGNVSTTNLRFENPAYSLYDASMGEWARDPSLPIETD